MYHYEFIKLARQQSTVTLSLNRPDKRNALHGPMIHELLHALDAVQKDQVRVLILQGEGECFCAGGDISWMQKLGQGSEDKNHADAQSLADLLYRLYTFPIPTIALAHGKVLGGGVGVVAAADICIAADNTLFGLPEVKIGLVPSIISPYVIQAIGERFARFYFLTGEQFNAGDAHQLGLVQLLSSPTELKVQGENLAHKLSKNSPQALHHAKELIQEVSQVKISPQLAQKTAQHLAELRLTPEAQEGLHAFIEKRTPTWNLS